MRFNASSQASSIMHDGGADRCTYHPYSFLISDKVQPSHRRPERRPAGLMQEAAVNGRALESKEVEGQPSSRRLDFACYRKLRSTRKKCLAKRHRYSGVHFPKNWKFQTSTPLRTSQWQLHGAACGSRDRSLVIESLLAPPTQPSMPPNPPPAAQ